MQHLRLTHRELGFWVDVRLRAFDAGWLAVADLADEPDVGVSKDPRRAVEDALLSLGMTIAREMTASVEVDADPSDESG